jgi:hypothetical protein
MFFKTLLIKSRREPFLTSTVVVSFLNNLITFRNSRYVLTMRGILLATQDSFLSTDDGDFCEHKPRASLTISSFEEVPRKRRVTKLTWMRWVGYIMYENMSNTYTASGGTFRRSPMCGNRYDNTETQFTEHDPRRWSRLKDSRYGLMMGFCEHGTGPSDSIKEGNVVTR